MKLEPEYARIIVCGVMHRGEFRWFVSEREYWFLDQIKWAVAFDGGDLDVDERFGIPVVNENSADLFLENMALFEVTTTELRATLKQRLPASGWEEFGDFCPSLYTDFDQRVQYSLFPEPASFEVYVPAGWTGVFGDFLGRIPEVERFWVVDGVDVFLPFFGNDSRNTG